MSVEEGIGARSPGKPFILTFDDGYDNNSSTVLPLTQEYGFKGVMFLLGDFSASANSGMKVKSPRPFAL